MATLLAGQDWSGEMVLRRRDGSTFLAPVVDTPIQDAEGALTAIVGVSEDVTDRRAAEAARGHSELRPRLEKVVDPDAFIDRVRRLCAEPQDASRDQLHLRDGRLLDRHGAPLHAEDGRYLGWA